MKYSTYIGERTVLANEILGASSEKRSVADLVVALLVCLRQTRDVGDSPHVVGDRVVGKEHRQWTLTTPHTVPVHGQHFITYFYAPISTIVSKVL